MLANPGNSQVARVAAGLQIKNSLTSKDPDIKAQYQQRWLAIDANARREVKNYVSNFCLFWSCSVGNKKNLLSVLLSFAWGRADGIIGF